VNRALRMLSDTNQALIHIADEMTLLNEVCQIIVEVGGYHMAWVSFAEQDEAKTVRPAAHAGFDSGYVESAKITWADNERGRGPGGTAIRTGLPCMARNIPEDPAFAPWHEAAIQRGYKSIIALPLISESQALGVLEIYSVDTDAFDTKEVEILKELAGDLAFGIAALRTRAKRDQAEVELRKSEERYRLVIENTAHSITIFDLNLKPTEYIAPSILKRRGYTVQEALTQTLDQMMTPDSLQLASKLFAEQMVLESSGTADPARTVLMELEEYCKDGSTIWVEIVASFLRDNNFKPTAILTVARDITERKHAEERLKETFDRLRKALETTIQVMMSAVESRDAYTAGHQRRSTNLACAIATEMGLTQEKIEGIRMAGSIHDIGKLSIPAEILSKPTKLTEIEFSLIKVHSQSGYEMLKDVESPWPLAEIVYQHHERMNGSGYPRNLKGDEIIMEARIMGVADVVETMASHRPYRPALGINVALEEIEKNREILYDNDVVDACLRLFREKGYQLT
jgi:PAS domain S-box-containing protein